MYVAYEIDRKHGNKSNVGVRLRYVLESKHERVILVIGFFLFISSHACFDRQDLSYKKMNTKLITLIKNVC